MGTAAINMAYIGALFNMLLQWIQLIEMILILSRLVHFMTYLLWVQLVELISIWRRFVHVFTKALILLSVMFLHPHRSRLLKCKIKCFII